MSLPHVDAPEIDSEGLYKPRAQCPVEQGRAGVLPEGVFFDKLGLIPTCTQTVARALSRPGLDQRGSDPHPRQPAPMLLQKADAMFLLAA
jgi:hypothetical protein